MPSDNKHNRRAFLKSSLAATTALGVAGCSGGGDGSQNTTTTSGNAKKSIHIVTANSTTESKKWFNTVADEFQKETGIGVNIDFIGLSPVKRIATLIQTGNPPDIATLDTGQAATLAQQDQLAPVGDLIKTAENQYNGKIPENVRLTMGGDNLLLPLWTNPTQVWYWSDVYKKHNLDPTAGITWDEYLNIAKTINSDNMSGTIVPSASTTLSAFTYWNFLLSTAGQVAMVENDEVKIALDSQKNGFKKKAVETVEFLNKLHQYSPRASSYSWSDILQSYVSRKGGHCIYGPRAKLQVISNRPDLSDQAKPHFPVSRSEKTFVNNGGGFGLLKPGPNKDAARKFLEFLLRDNRIIDFLTSVAPVHNFPTITSIPDMDAYKNAPFIKKNFTDKELKTISASFKKGVSWGGETDPYNPYGPSLFSSKHLGTLLYNVNIQDKAPEKAVEDTADRLRKTLKSAKGK